MSRFFGELVPVGGGDSIPLARPVMTVGRRDSCDICLKFQNISSSHCEFNYIDGYWQIKDLGSTNGIKVNGTKTMKKALKPGDEISIATHRYVIQYSLLPNAKSTLESALAAEDDDIFGQSLMEKAGLEKPRSKRQQGGRGK